MNMGGVLSQNNLHLQGVMDLQLPSGSSDGKAIHLVASADIADLSVYGIGVANNGGGTDGEELTLPALSVNSGDDILVARNDSAIGVYFDDCFSEFELVLEASSAISQNGDDAIELFLNGEAIEVFGDVDTDGTGEPWEYLDSWAYQVNGVWTYGGVECTLGSVSSVSSNCPYPLCPVPEVIPGCTDAEAFNYNPNATEDDGSCEDVLIGCLVASADNYDALANTPCEDCCEYVGCTDSTALNFDPGANLDDGSCLFDTGGLSNALDLVGVIDFTVPSGGSDGKALHFRALEDIADLGVFGVGVANNGDGTDGQEYVFPTGSASAGDDILLARNPEVMSAYLGDCASEFETVLTGNSDISQNGDDAIELFESGVVIETYGDVDVDGTGEAWEYTDSWAYQANGQWTVGGIDCTDGTTTMADATCLYPLCPLPEVIFGCTDPLAFNYNALATDDDGSCEDVAIGCLEASADNYDETANTPCEGCCEFGGCTDDNALNYDANATVDDGTCVFAVELTLALDLVGVMDFTVPSGGSDGKAIHVRALANIDDLSAFGLGVANNGGGTDGQEYTFPAISVSEGDDILVARNDSVMSLYFGSCYSEFEVVLDASDDISQNGDDAIELFESTIQIETYGDADVDGSGEAWEYTDSWAYQDGEVWTIGGLDCTDGTTTLAESTCPYPMCAIVGCTDPYYLEFNPFAAEDDGSCATLVVYGCLYDAASNFNILANVDDGSCAFDDDGGDCPTDIDGDGATAVGDLLVLLGAFGLECQ